MDFPESGDGDSAHKRSKNFSCKEVDLLLNLIAKHVGVIECKRTDKIAQTSKDAVWKSIEKEFNDSSNEIYRDVKTLKGKYDNVKKQSKKKWAENKDAFKAGGDVSTPASDNLNETDYKIKDILGDSLLNRTVKSTYDKDFYQSLITEQRTQLRLALNGQTSQSEDSSAETKLYGVNLSSNEELSNQTASDSLKQEYSPLTREKLARYNQFSKYNYLLKPVLSSIIEKKKKNSLHARKIVKTSDSAHELITLRKKVLKQQLKLRREDHNLKMACMQKEHEEKIKLLKLRIKNEELVMQTRLVEIQHITSRHTTSF